MIPYHNVPQVQMCTNVDQPERVWRTIAAFEPTAGADAHAVSVQIGASATIHGFRVGAISEVGVGEYAYCALGFPPPRPLTPTVQLHSATSVRPPPASPLPNEWADRARSALHCRCRCW